MDGVYKPNGCIITSCNKNEKSERYQKHQIKPKICMTIISKTFISFIKRYTNL